MENIGEEFVSGFVSIVGRPNVGKSTLMNRFLGEKLAIMTPKPQTTRNQIRGILNQERAQIVFVDTPGVPEKFGGKKGAFLEFLGEEALKDLEDVDLVLFVLDGQVGLTAFDLQLWQKIMSDPLQQEKTLVLVNKVDQIKPKEKILLLMKEISEKMAAQDIFPCSAKSGLGVEEIMEKIRTYLPWGPPLYPLDQLSDQNDRFWVSEIIREKLFLSMHQEIPYSIAVQVQEFQERERVIQMEAHIFVERISQKGMVIGKNARVLKKVGSLARAELEKLFGKKIFLNLQVKVLKNWSRNENYLKELGYGISSVEERSL